MIAKRIVAHLMILLIALPPQALMADMLTRNTLGGAAGAAGTPADTSGANANAVNPAAAAAQARAAAQDMLTRNTLALQAVQNMQAAARAAASTQNNAGMNPNMPGMTLPDVPDGLGAGGLQLTSVTGANTPAQSVQNARTIVQIQQTQQQAMLEWSSFNIGRNTTLKFDQSNTGTAPASSIAFNRVTDPTGNPSQILGSIESQGQVYVINQNGIIFGGASVVNTGSLVASSLPINDNLISRGLLNNPDAQFLFSANAQAAGTKGPTPAYTPPAPPAPPASGRIGNVTVQAGAQITAPTSSANVGGRVALIGPNVSNEGSISTPDGQTILAGGMQVGFDAHSSSDPSLRGLDVYVGDVGTYGGTATNAGLITAPRGSVLITGKNVNQNGFIQSTTSVGLNGRVDLLANYNAIPNASYNASRTEFGPPFVYPTGTSTGIVRTGAGSVIQVLPEWSSASKINGTELALKSQVNMQGLGIYLGAGSVVHAPNAQVALSAGIWDLVTGSQPVRNFVSSTGQVYLDQNAVVDVSGSTAIAATISDYILTVTLRGAELADSALQRNGSLRGQEITVDMRETGTRADGTTWYGTPLANLTGYLGIVERTVGQLTTDGGNISVKAGESVVMQSGSKLNVSGGYQDFAAGVVATTRLIDDGNYVDIAKADASVVYDGVFTPLKTTNDPRWGITTTTGVPVSVYSRAEAAHTRGGNGGAIQISSAAMALDGVLQGGTVTGTQQTGAAPRLSSLALNLEAQQFIRTPLVFPLHSPTPAALEFRAGGGTLAVQGAFALNGSGVPVALRQERKDTVILDSALVTTRGFGVLTVKNQDGSILVPEDVTLAAPAGGSLTLMGANVTVLGRLLAPAGSITISANTISPYAAALLDAQDSAAVLPPANPARGRITTGARTVMSTAGLIINDRADAPAPLTTLHGVRNASGGITDTTHGGTIVLKGYTVDLAAGGLLDVSGGLVADRSFHFGDAGTLQIQAGNDPYLHSILGGALSLNAELRGFSGAQGGTLQLQAPLIQIGGSSAAHANTLLLQPAFFSTGGFASFDLTGLGADITPVGGARTYAPGVFITAGTVVRPEVRSLLAEAEVVNGVSRILTRTVLNPEGYRAAASLSFHAPGVLDFVDQRLRVRGDILVGAGARVETDALGTILLSGQTVELHGGLFAAGGSVTVSGGNHFAEEFGVVPSSARATVTLGATAVISTAGRTVLTVNDPYNYTRGTVHGGGTIRLAGNILAATGAALDVSGTSAWLDLQPQDAGVTLSTLNAGGQLVLPSLAVRTRVESDAGQITLAGGEFVYSRATLSGRAGGSTAEGGTLVVDSGRFIAPGLATDDKDITLLVTQTLAELAPLAATPSMGAFAVESFAQGGFDSLDLRGNVDFRGAVDITAAAALKIADGGVISSTGLTRLTARYVHLGRALQRPTRDEDLLNPFQVDVPGVGTLPSQFSPTYGSGRLEVTADLIESGFLSLQNIGQAALTAREDYRGSGSFDIAGHLTITAGQLYPVTASTLTITAYDYLVSGTSTSGSVTFRSSGVTPQFPLSGGGRLNVFASTITQGGVLRAPQGSIRLGWDGTGTAPKGLVTNANVPVTQQVTLASGGLTSVSAIDPTSGAGVRIPYGIIKDGTNWIDPTGFDISGVGAPEKNLRVTARNVTTEAGSTLDVRGGGELYGYRWIEGNGGTSDILASEGSFAILPGYRSLFSPYAPYADGGPFVANLGGDHGYLNNTLKAGDSIFLKGSTLAAAGEYTLLPARYALLPGALLITPSSAQPGDAVLKPGGAVQTSGYRFNGLNPDAGGQIYSSFEIAPLSVVLARAEYASFSAQSFIPSAQQRLSLAATRGPLDAGYALLSAQQTMQLAGAVSAAGGTGGRGGRVDVSSPQDIVITAPGAAPQSGKLMLDATLLSGWTAESLIIGGERTSTGTVNVRTSRLTLDNAGAPLRGTDIVLAATQNVTLAAGSVLTQTGTQNTADSFVVNGNGALVRVSGVLNAQTTRTGVTTATQPQLVIGPNSVISGKTVTLDSTSITTLDPGALPAADSLQLSSGRISIQLTNPGTLQPNAGLLLGGSLLTAFQGSKSFSLVSYSSIDLYGTGTLGFTGALELHAGEIRGFNQNSGQVALTAKNLLLDNSSLGSVPGIVSAANGSLSLTADSIVIGKNALTVDQFTNVTLNAAQGLIVRESGSFRTQSDLSVFAPTVRAASGATQAIIAGGALRLERGAGVASSNAAGLGAQLLLQGSSILANTEVQLPSGIITLNATAGGIDVQGTLDAGGLTRSFFDATRNTDAGQITLTATGSVQLSSTGVLNVAAAAGGGNAGLLRVSAGTQLTLLGTLRGAGGAGATQGSVDIDVGSLPSFTDLNTRLNAGSFTQSRELRLLSGDLVIDGTVTARRFLAAADQGSITVNGTVNAAGITGGRIDLIARGDVTLASGSLLTVRGQNFDSAGKGGAVWLESGASINGTIGTGSVTIATGSTVDLRVDAQTAGSAARGQFSGKLHLRAPQNATRTDMLINAIGGSVLGASAIEIEGYRVYDYNQANVLLRAGPLTISGETLNVAVLHTDATNFFTNYTAMESRILGGVSSTVRNAAVLMPGVEIVNRQGNISLGTASTPGSLNTGSAAVSDWNLATSRYGPKNAPGVLTLRAAGNLEFYNTLSDGFDIATSGNVVERMWMGTLSAQNTALPENTQSWSMRLTSGADVAAANVRETRALTALGSSSGSLLLGKDAGQARTSVTTSGANALTRLAINPNNSTATTGNPTTSNRFQVIRTGTGDIEINAGRDVQLLNQFATIYTAGVQVSDATKVITSGDFFIPQVAVSSTDSPDQGTALGAVQQLYAAQYALGGGNVIVNAQSSITHLTRQSGALIADSQRQLPNNWLLRRGYVDPQTSQYGSLNVAQSDIRQLLDPSASTSWWVNYSNFFDGVAALGGGHVVLNAGQSVENVSAHAPTNARAASGVPSTAGFVELGGGDVTVLAGLNIDGGLYYVERGAGTLNAGGAITTNATRSPTLGRVSGATNIVDDPATWLPVTLFAGKSKFDVSARGDVLLGPVANTFLLPQGLTNRHWYKTYFSTYAADSAVSVVSLGGTVTLRQAATLSDASSPLPLLQQWITRTQLISSNSVGNFHPWLRSVETTAAPFGTWSTVMPGTLRVTAFSGGINIVGNLNLSPSPQGTLELLASGAVHGLMRTGASNTIITGSTTSVWSSSTLNLSDASPGAIPSILSPFSYLNFLNGSTSNTLHRTTNTTFLQQRNSTFIESGSITGAFASTQAKQNLHAAGLLHASDTLPVLVYAGAGDVSGLTLFSGKSSRIIAQRDVTDVGLYLQNVRASDTSLVSAGRDIIAYNANSVLRSQAAATGNLRAVGETPKSGDIQINGPGTLQVLAGRDLDLGTGSNNIDGTGVGITSIGNGRNPYLPFAGADIVIAAGMGGVSSGLGGSNAKFADFIYAIQYAQGSLPGTPVAPKYELDGRRYLAELAELMQRDGLRGLPSGILTTDPNGPALSFESGENLIFPTRPLTGYPNSINLNDPALSTEQRDQLALALFFLALRDAGRDRNNPDSPDVNTYRAGYEAIQTMFPVADQFRTDPLTGLPLTDPLTGDPIVETTGIDLLQQENRPLASYVHDGDIRTQARDIRTRNGGNISILAPGGGLQLAPTLIGETLAPPGIITESGGGISIFTDADVSIGISRIFTLRGGDINIWSTVGDIAAGSSSKTVQSAPPTRVLIDPQSASVATDLAGLATGGGIGVLATVAGVRPGNVDLIAPIGAVDAGDAGIRATGNLNIAAAVVLNAANISVGGSSAGAPSAPSVATPSLGGLSSAAAATAATNSSPAAQQSAQQQAEAGTDDNATPSIITVEVLGYGGGDGSAEDDERKRRGGAE